MEPEQTMSASIRTQITARIEAMLATLTPDTARTGIGLNVSIGLSQLNAPEVPSVTLTPGADRAVQGYGNSLTETEYAITAFVNRKEARYAAYTADPGAGWALVDAMIADIRQVLETPDADLEDLIELISYEGTRPAYSEEGGEIIGAELRYNIQYRIAKGDPDSLPS